MATKGKTIHVAIEGGGEVLTEAIRRPPVVMAELKRQIGCLDSVLEDGNVQGWAWNELLPSRPAQITIHVDGDRLAVMQPQDFRADLVTAGIGHGCCAFTWRLPERLRDGKEHELRIFHVDFELELPGSPRSFSLAEERSTSETSVFHNARFDNWPGGLSGRAHTPASEIGLGIYLSFDQADSEAGFTVCEPRFPGGDELPYYGVRITTAADKRCWVLHRFGEGAGRLLASGVMVSLEVALGASLEPLSQRVAEVCLYRQTRSGFEKLRRLARARAFRKPTLLAFEIRLGADEVRLLESRTLFLGASVEKAEIFSIYPAQQIRITRSGSPALSGFEDANLEKAIIAIREMAQVHGYGEKLDHLMRHASARVLKATPITSSRSAQSISHMSYPFTQIVIPTFNGDSIVESCLRSVQAQTTSPFQALILNDGSRQHTSDMLRSVVDHDPRFVILDREHNKGYTKSVNEAIKLTSAMWTVILNSDTIVPEGWLAKLHDAALAYANVGMVGPLSNAASWQSLPKLKEADGTWSKNSFIEPHHLEAVQAILDDLSERAYPVVPLLNGFCTLIKRDVFERIGLLDEDAFPIGYGEETDLCIRACKAGFVLVVADDCFVYHRKSVTFGTRGRKGLSKLGNMELTNKHVGTIIPSLERSLQNDPALSRLRAKLINLRSELD
jgi:GT2 family glycosyltransferase